MWWHLAQWTVDAWALFCFVLVLYQVLWIETEEWRRKRQEAWDRYQLRCELVRVRRNAENAEAEVQHLANRAKQKMAGEAAVYKYVRDELSSAFEYPWDE